MRFSLIVMLIWAQLSYAQDDRLVMQTGHSEMLTVMAFDETGKFLATGSKDRSVIVRDAKKGIILERLRGHTESVVYTKFLSSKILLSVSSNESILWDFQTGKSLSVIDRGVRRDFHVTANKHAEIFFLVYEGKLNLWRPERGTVTEINLPDEMSNVESIRSVADSGELILEMENYSVLWDVNKQSKIKEFAHQTEILHSWVDLKSNTYFVCNNYLSIQSFDIETGKLKRGGFSLDFMNGVNHDARHTKFSVEDDKVAVANGKEFSIHSISNRNQESQNRIESSRNFQITALAINPTKKWFVAAVRYKLNRETGPIAMRNKEDHYEYELRYFNLKTGYEIRSFAEFSPNFKNIRFSHNGRKIAVVGEKSVLVWSASNLNNPVLNDVPWARQNDAVYWSPDDKVIAFGGKRRNYSFAWQLRDGKVRKLTDHFDYLFDTEWSRYLTISSDYTRIVGSGRVHNLKTGEHISSFNLERKMYSGSLIPQKQWSRELPEKEPIRAISTNGKLLATTQVLHHNEYTHYVNLIDIDESQHLGVLRQFDGESSDGFYHRDEFHLEFSPNDSILAVSGVNIDLIDVPEFKELYKIGGDKSKDYFGEMSFSFDGKFLAVSGRNNKVTIINPKSGKIIKELNGHSDEVISVHFKPNSYTLASLGEDDLIIFWDVVKGERIATLILEERGFFVVTPDNYYYSTKSSLNRAAFRSKSGIHLFKQFDLKYNRPDILMERLDMASAKQIEIMNLAYQKRLKKYGYTEEDVNEFGINEPPSISINSDELPIAVEEDSVKIKIEAKSFRKVTSIQVTVNSVPLPIIPVRPSNHIHKELAICLTPGKNLIEVGCSDDRGVESFKQVHTVYCNVKKSPNLYLVTVGISNYKDERMNLEFAAKDAQDLASAMHDNSYYTKKHTLIVKDEDVDLDLLNKVSDFIEDAKPEDMILMYYSGHGILDKDFNYYLSTHHSDYGDPKTGSLPYEDFENLLRSTQSRNKLLILDACHAGELDPDLYDFEEGLATDRSKSTNASLKPKLGILNSFNFMNAAFSDIDNSTGANVIAASGGEQLAFEHDELENGLFTSAFLEGLRQSDEDGDGLIRLSELLEYTRNRVYSLSAGKQLPNARLENNELDYVIYQSNLE
ncbi:MAG: caspase family protein [Flavobacteriales bacterium]|nr:caspase family protein [Flavobacteriales bacterium]